MKKFLQLTVVLAGLAGLSACAATGDTYMDGSRTAGGDVSAQIAACQTRVARLEEMNRACYRK